MSGFPLLTSPQGGRNTEGILTIKTGKVWKWRPGLGLHSYRLCHKMQQESPENPQQSEPLARATICFAGAKAGQPELSPARRDSAWRSCKPAPREAAFPEELGQSAASRKRETRAGTARAAADESGGKRWLRAGLSAGRGKVTPRGGNGSGRGPAAACDAA